MDHPLRQKLLWPILASLLLFSSTANAVFELSVSGSLRRSNLDKNNFTNASSASGSIAYYFTQLSALEISYTNGSSEVVSNDNDPTLRQSTTTDFQLIGADIILSPGDSKSAFRPFFKLGAVHIQREIEFETSVGNLVVKPEDGIAPSAGAGVRLKLGNRFSIKLGLDGWTNPLNDDTDDDTVVNWAAKASLSIYL